MQPFLDQDHGGLPTQAKLFDAKLDRPSQIGSFCLGETNLGQDVCQTKGSTWSTPRGYLPKLKAQTTDGPGRYLIVAHGTSIDLPIQSGGSLLNDLAMLCFRGSIFEGATSPSSLRIIEVIAPVGAVRRVLRDKISLSTSPVYRAIVHADLKPPAQIAKGQSFAASLIARSRAAARLTMDEFSTLLGITRRSLQAWKAGEALSSKNEHRLRRVTDLLESIAPGDQRSTRDKLFQVSAGGLRLYDAIAQNRLDDAKSWIALGQFDDANETPVQKHERSMHLTPLASRLDLIPEPVNSADRNLNRKLSGRIRR